MYSQYVKGDGGCLFTSLSISLRCKKILKEPICYSSPCLNSQSNEHSGFQIRQAIIHFLLNHLHSEIQELGTFNVIKDENNEQNGNNNAEQNGNNKGENGVENSVKNEKEMKKELVWKGKDILNLELARHTDILQNEKKQMLQILKYLKNMTLYHSWGSTPEYIAFSLIFKYPVNIWRLENGELILNDTFPLNKNNMENECINLLFCNGNHYEPLITEKEKVKLLEIFTSLQEFNKKYIIKNTL